jgi:poly(hydroxyalkanoate) depolymerase family esterase
MRAFLVGVLMLSGLLVTTPAASAAGITEVTGFGSNPGALRMFEYQPAGLTPGRPLVVALHGCTQDASYGTNAGWIELADKWKFGVVLAQQPSANNIQSCFNWFQPGDITRGQGEASSIAQMVARGLSDTGGDGSRVYVTGLSGGGAMTSVMLATYPELFAGGGIVAGLPYGCATSMVDAFSCMTPGKNKTPAQWGDAVRAASGGYAGPWPTVSIWQGSADYTVATMNLTELAEQWTNVHGVASTPSATDTVGGYPHAVYNDASGRTVVQTYSITGMGHGQPVDPGTGDGQCGHATAFVLDVNVCAAWQLGLGWQLNQ